MILLWVCRVQPVNVEPLSSSYRLSDQADWLGCESLPLGCYHFPPPNHHLLSDSLKVDARVAVPPTVERVWWFVVKVIYCTVNMKLHISHCPMNWPACQFHVFSNSRWNTVINYHFSHQQLLLVSKLLGCWICLFRCFHAVSWMIVMAFHFKISVERILPGGGAGGQRPNAWLRLKIGQW